MKNLTKYLMMMTLSSSVYADSNVDKHVEKSIEISHQEKHTEIKEAIDNLFAHNLNIRNLLRVIESKNAGGLSESLKDMFSASVQNKKDLSEDHTGFSGWAFVGNMKVGVDTLFTIGANKAKAQKAMYDDGALPALEKFVAEYLETVIKYNAKRKQLVLVEEYVKQRRKDLGEYESRAKFGDISKDELAEFRAKQAALETEHQELSSEVRILESSLLIYIPSDVVREDYRENDVDHFVPNVYSDSKTLIESNKFVEAANIDLEDIEKLVAVEATPERFSSTSLLKSAYSLKAARFESVSDTMSFIPRVSFDIERYFAEDDLKKSKNSLSMKLYVDISPSTFVDSVKSYSLYEAAKYSHAWAKMKYEHDYNKMLFDVKTARSGFRSASKLFEAKQLALASVAAQYEGGAEYEKLRRAREEYKQALDRYFQAREKYTKTLFEYAELTGQIRDYCMQYIGSNAKAVK